MLKEADVKTIAAKICSDSDLPLERKRRSSGLNLKIKQPQFSFKGGSNKSAN